MVLPKFDVEALTLEERLLLIEKLWDSLEGHDVPLTPAQQADLARRLADIEKNPNDQMSWEDAQRRIWGQSR